MHYRPLNKQILIRPVDSKQTTSGGIVLPDSAVERIYRAEVLAISDAIKKPRFEVGAVVVYHQHAYERKVKDGKGNTLCFIDYKDALAVVLD